MILIIWIDKHQIFVATHLLWRLFLMFLSIFSYKNIFPRAFYVVMAKVWIPLYVTTFLVSWKLFNYFSYRRVVHLWCAFLAWEMSPWKVSRSGQKWRALLFLMAKQNEPVHVSTLRNANVILRRKTLHIGTSPHCGTYFAMVFTAKKATKININIGWIT